MSAISMTKVNFTNGSGEPINDTNLNAIQTNAETAINEVQTNLESATTITTGTATMDTTYTIDVEYNHWEKVGQVVSYSFTFRVNGTWNNTTTFATGLPNPKSATRFLGVNTSSNVPFRCMLSTTGTLSNAYSQTTPTNNQVVEGHITYITTD